MINRSVKSNLIMFLIIGIALAVFSVPAIADWEECSAMNGCGSSPDYDMLCMAENDCCDECSGDPECSSFCTCIIPDCDGYTPNSPEWTQCVNSCARTYIGTPLTNGTGTENDPYQISTCANLYEDLDNHCDEVGAYFILTNGLDCSAYTYPNPSACQYTDPFMGILNGQGHTISGTYFNDTMEGSVNIGGIVASSAGTITNIKLFNLYLVSGSSPIGGAVGVESGGSAGHLENITIQNSTILTNSDHEPKGLLMGENSYTTITNSYAKYCNTNQGGDGVLIGNDISNGSFNKVYSMVLGGTTAFSSMYSGLNNYYNSDYYNGTDSSNATALTDAEMKDPSNFNTWDFDNIWGVNDNDEYPCLLWEDNCSLYEASPAINTTWYDNFNNYSNNTDPTDFVDYSSSFIINDQYNIYQDGVGNSFLRGDATNGSYFTEYNGSGVFSGTWTNYEVNTNLIIREDDGNVGAGIIVYSELSDGDIYHDYLAIRSLQSDGSFGSAFRAKEDDSGDFICNGNRNSSVLAEINKSYNIKAQITSGTSTKLIAKVWQSNASEPTNWEINVTCTFIGTPPDRTLYNGSVGFWSQDSIVDYDYISVELLILPTAPSITSINYNSPVVLNSGTNKLVSTLINATDINGDLNISLSEVLYTKAAQDNISSSSCSEISHGTLWYYFNCTATFPYYTQAGVWSVNVTLRDNNGHTTSNSSLITVIQPPPTVTTQSPYTTFDRNQNITITTDVNSTCRWALTDIDYSSMTLSLTGTETSHWFNYSAFTVNANNSFYISCNSTYGNYNNATNNWNGWLKLNNIAPQITINSPANNTASSLPRPTVNVTVVDDDNATVSCGLYVDGILNSTNPSVVNNTATTFSPYWSYTNHSYYLNCTDGINNSISGLRYYQYQVPPLYIYYDELYQYVNGIYYNNSYHLSYYNWTKIGNIDEWSDDFQPNDNNNNAHINRNFLYNMDTSKSWDILINTYSSKYASSDRYSYILLYLKNGAYIAIELNRQMSSSPYTSRLLVTCGGGCSCTSQSWLTSQVYNGILKSLLSYNEISKTLKVTRNDGGSVNVNLSSCSLDNMNLTLGTIGLWTRINNVNISNAKIEQRPIWLHSHFTYTKLNIFNFTLQLNVTDPNNDPLIYSSNDSNFNVSSSGLITYSGNLPQGIYTVNYTVTDNFTENSSRIGTFNTINTAPTIGSMSVSPSVAYLNEALTFKVNCTNPDAGDFTTANCQLFNGTNTYGSLVQLNITPNTLTTVCSVPVNIIKKWQNWTAEFYCFDYNATTARQNISINISNTAPLFYDVDVNNLNLTANLEHYYSFNGMWSSGNADSVGGLTLTNEAEYTSSGKISTAAEIATIHQRTMYANDNHIHTNLSFSLWFKAYNSGSYVANSSSAVLLSQNAMNIYTIGLIAKSGQYGAPSGTIQLINPTTGSCNITTNFTISNSVWYHAVVTIDGTNDIAKLYINGELIGTDISGCNGGFRYPIKISDWYGIPESSFFGAVDEVGYWNETLSSLGVLMLYNSNQAFAYPMNNRGNTLWPQTIFSEAIDTNTSYTRQLYAFEADSIDTLTYYSNDSMFPIDLNTGFITNDALSGGIYVVNYSVFDGIGYDYILGTFDVTQLVTTPEIVSIDYSSPVTLNSGTDKLVYTIINVTDGDHDFNISLSEVLYTKATQDNLSSSSCSEISHGTRWYYFNCTATFPYYTQAGVWSVNVTLRDNNGHTTLNSSLITVNSLDSISINSSAMSFGMITPGQNDIASSSISISNYGNTNYSVFSVKSYHLNSSTGSVINPSNFCVNDIASASVGCNAMINNTAVNITGIVLPTGLSSQDIIYPYMDVPTGLGYAVYWSSAPWVLEAS